MKLSTKEKYAQAQIKRCRLRDLGIVIGNHPTGPFNAITDVKGVKVGHTTLIEGTGKKRPGRGPVRSGVTAIIPTEKVYERKLIANTFTLNGAGEIAGLTQINEWGLIETPIALTNTLSVGRVSDSVVKWMAQKYEEIWDKRQVVIPVVGECDDSFLNDSVGLHIRREHVFSALESAKTGPVAEGCAGSGTGMICCDLKAGIGTSSRVIYLDDTPYTIGVLVMSNFGTLGELRVDGFPMGKVIAKKQELKDVRKENYGSIIAVIATDLPLAAIQIQRLCKRAALGIGRVGSYAAYGSGEIILGFSTANVVKVGRRPAKEQYWIIADEFLNPAYQAVIEATEEAILNALTSAIDMEGVDGHHVRAIDLELLRTMYSSFQKIIE